MGAPSAFLPSVLTASAVAIALVACSGASSTNLFVCPDAGASCDEQPTLPVPGGGEAGDGADGSSPAPHRDGGHPAADAGVDAAIGGPCNRDAECPAGLCNLRIDRCAAPSPDGGPCARDSECASGLCNLRLDVCAEPAADGDACARDSECAGALCNLRTDRCAAKAPLGGPCARDSECASSLCNLRTDVCATKAAAGSPCARDRECASGLCNTAVDACN